jgi:hypothetical protein
VAYRLLASDLESTEVGMTDRDKYRDNDDRAQSDRRDDEITES